MRMKLARMDESWVAGLVQTTWLVLGLVGFAEWVMWHNEWGRHGRAREVREREERERRWREVTAMNKKSHTARKADAAELRARAMERDADGKGIAGGSGAGGADCDEEGK